MRNQVEAAARRDPRRHDQFREHDAVGGDPGAHRRAGLVADQPRAPQRAGLPRGRVAAARAIRRHARRGRGPLYLRLGARFQAGLPPHCPAYRRLLRLRTEYRQSNENSIKARAPLVRSGARAFACGYNTAHNVNRGVSCAHFGCVPPARGGYRGWVCRPCAGLRCDCGYCLATIGGAVSVAVYAADNRTKISGGLRDSGSPSPSASTTQRRRGGSADRRFGESAVGCGPAHQPHSLSGGLPPGACSQVRADRVQGRRAHPSPLRPGAEGEPGYRRVRDTPPATRCRAWVPGIGEYLHADFVDTVGFYPGFLATFSSSPNVPLGQTHPTCCACIHMALWAMPPCSEYTSSNW